MLDNLRKTAKKLLIKAIKNKNEDEIEKISAVIEVLKYDNCFQLLTFQEAQALFVILKIEDWQNLYAKLLSV